MTSKAFISLGTNLGDRMENLQKARKMIQESCGKIITESGFYETEAWGFVTPDKFLNQALKISTSLSPVNLLIQLKIIEAKMGRIKSGETYESRIIDIDILLFNERVMNTPELTIPHPRLHLRQFALVPLNEIAGHLLHPVIKKTISELLNSCTDPLEVKPYEISSPL